MSKGGRAELELQNEYQTDTMSKLSKDKLELYEQTQELQNEKKIALVQHAELFANKILEKYGTNYPLHLLLKKALKYQEYYKLKDDEFNLFKNIYEKVITKQKPELKEWAIPKTRMKLILGDPNAKNTYEPSDSERKIIKEIEEKTTQLKELHINVTTSSVLYNDMGLTALHTTYDKNRDHSYMHPVLVAMFVPKFDKIDEIMLLSNFGHIIKSRFKNEKIKTKADYLLLSSVISDVNDIVCDKSSPFTDLKYRFSVQEKLWECVIKIRRGKYYEKCAGEFMQTLETCGEKSPQEILYMIDPCLIYRKLSAVFSFKPMIYKTSLPGFGSQYVNMVQLGVESVPFITIDLDTQQTAQPMSYIDPSTGRKIPLKSDDEEYINLTSGFKKTASVYYGGKVTEKSDEFIYADNVLVFSVNRAKAEENTILTQYVNSVDTYRSSHQPLFGFEKINTKPINVDITIMHNKASYELKSVVCIVPSPYAVDIAIGTACYMYDSIRSKYIAYDPIGANFVYSKQKDRTEESIPPAAATGAAPAPATGAAPAASAPTHAFVAASNSARDRVTEVIFVPTLRIVDNEIGDVDSYFKGFNDMVSSYGSLYFYQKVE